MEKWSERNDQIAILEFSKQDEPNIRKREAKWSDGLQTTGYLSIVKSMSLTRDAAPLESKTIRVKKRKTSKIDLFFFYYRTVEDLKAQRELRMNDNNHAGEVCFIQWNFGGRAALIRRPALPGPPSEPPRRLNTLSCRVGARGQPITFLLPLPWHLPNISLGEPARRRSCGEIGGKPRRRFNLQAPGATTHDGAKKKTCDFHERKLIRNGRVSSFCLVIA